MLEKDMFVVSTEVLGCCFLHEFLFHTATIDLCFRLESSDDPDPTTEKSADPDPSADKNLANDPETIYNHVRESICL